MTRDDSVSVRVERIVRDETRRVHLGVGPVVRCHGCGCEVATDDAFSGQADGGRRVYFCQHCNLEEPS